jgi:hypothetical protein
MNDNQLNTFSQTILTGLGVLLGVNGVVIGIMLERNFRKWRRFIGANMHAWKYLGLLSIGAGAVLLYGEYPSGIQDSCVLLGLILLFCSFLLKRNMRTRIEEIEDTYSRPRLSKSRQQKGSDPLS